MNLDSQHLISTKCKLLKQYVKFISVLPFKQRTHSAKILQGRTSINDSHSNTLNQIDNFGPYAIVTITS